MNLRSTYVSSVRALRALPGTESLLHRMAKSEKPSIRHVRTLFAVYDTEDLIALDFPWWTYSAIRDVERFLAQRPMRVFEFGAGASTVWLAKRAAQVISVEHDVDYASRLSPLLRDFNNVTLHVVPPVASVAPEAASGRRGYEGFDFSAYVDTCQREGGVFDMVVVDGRARVACLEAGLDRLSDDGVVLFDDIRRDRYGSALERTDLDVEVLAGAKPSLPYRDATALIRRRRT